MSARAAVLAFPGRLASFRREGWPMVPITILAVLALLAIVVQKPVAAAILAIPAAFYVLKLCFDLLRVALKGHGELLMAIPQVIGLNFVQLFVRFIAMNRVLAFDNPREAFQQGERPPSA